jgi:LysM repeat protein
MNRTIRVKNVLSRPFHRTSSPSYSLALFLLLALFFWTSSAQAVTPPRSRGARPIALGNGYTAVTGDVYSLLYNPAGLFDILQPEMAFDYGRANMFNTSAVSDFNFAYATPHRYKDLNVPLGFSFYGEQAAPGAHIIDMTAGGAMEAPIDRWTKGFFKLPTKIGVAATLRHQNGDDKSSRVGKAGIGLGLTGGATFPINKSTQFGLALRNLYLGDAEPVGPSLNAGIVHLHKRYLNMMADLTYSSGGIWRFHPGLEWLMARGVIRPRLGWGYRDSGGVNTVATGIGFYASPVQIDIAYLIPTKTLTDNTDQFRASVTYRFGKPQFTEIYYDRALEEAGNLDKKVLGMTVKEAELKASLAEIEQKRRMANEDLLNMKQRIQSLKDQDVLGDRDQKIRQLQYRLQAAESELNTYKSRARSAAEQRAKIRKHTVKAGETLQALAREYYGDPNLWKKIYDANPDKIDRGLPRVGSVLVIP